MSSILCAGLDPANPLFTGGASGRLASGDATLVDTIVTDGDGLGLLNPIGDVNFYPNGGRRVQPGCGIFDIGGEPVWVNVYWPLCKSPELCRS